MAVFEIDETKPIEKEEKSKIHLSVERNEYQHVKLLLETGLSKITSSEAFTISEIAIKNNNFDLLKLFVSHGIHDHYSNWLGRDLLRVALQNQCEDQLIIYLIENVYPEIIENCFPLVAFYKRKLILNYLIKEYQINIDEVFNKILNKKERKTTFLDPFGMEDLIRKMVLREVYDELKEERNRREKR